MLSDSEISPQNNIVKISINFFEGLIDGQLNQRLSISRYWDAKFF